jgi:protein-disulfide isomerase
LLEQEAAKRNLSLAALLDSEINAKVAPVTDAEIEAFYQANRHQIPANDPAIRTQIKNYLQQQRTAQRRQQFVQMLRTQAQVAVNLMPPRLRIQASSAGAPFKGGANAPVTIIEFSDFHCPFCIRVQPTLAQVLARYGDKVKLVYRDLPLDQLHPQARRAAEAARCAQEQGKFWPFHDQLYSGNTDTSPERFKALAQATGLELAAFESCLASGKQQALVQQSIEEATRLGLSGTPAFLINGRFLSGAQPFETFVAVIEEELARTRDSQSPSKTQQQAK